MDAPRSPLALRLAEDAAREAETAQASVLFADVRGFTRFCEGRFPESALRTLNALFGAVVPEVRAAGGEVDKFLGDGFMAVFGAPRGGAGHAASAVACALRMVERSRAFNAARSALGLPTLELGIGVNSGRVVAGFVGCAARGEYTVIGDAVNLAARLEQAAEAGQVLVGPETARALRGQPDVELRALAPARLKGLAHEVAIHEVRPAAQAEPCRPPAAPSDARPRLLLVDDDPAVLKPIARLLAPHYDVSCARDGREALLLREELDPDLVISDVEMPGMDGLALCRELKKEGGALRTPIILMSGALTDDLSASGALDSGADDYIVKPPSAAVLLSRVRAVLRRY